MDKITKRRLEFLEDLEQKMDKVIEALDDIDNAARIADAYDRVEYVCNYTTRIRRLIG